MGDMRKPLLILGIFAVLLIGGFLVLNSYIYNQKQAGAGEVPTPYRATLTGEYICLPPPAEGSPCTEALKTDQAEYYVIDFNLMSQEKPELREGDRFTASGVMTPIEYLSTDHWQTYPVEIEGIFSITDSVQKQ
jgi:hypothetical protein